MDERTEAELKQLDEYTTDMNGCARCHGDGHKAVTFRKLTHPLEMPDGSAPMTHWARCPSNGEPIMMMFFDKPEPQT